MPAGAKLQARLSPPEITVAKLEPPKNELNKNDIARSQPLKSEPVKIEAVKADPKPEISGVNHERLQKTITGWVIQLGAMDDEDKAKAVLDEARSRSGRMLAKAASFTEKVVREGSTLYRARLSGFRDADSAQDACKSLKRSGFNCFATRS